MADVRVLIANSGIFRADLRDGNGGYRIPCRYRNRGRRRRGGPGDALSTFAAMIGGCCAGFISGATLAGTVFSIATGGACLSGTARGMTGGGDCTTCVSAGLSTLAGVGLNVATAGAAGGVTAWETGGFCGAAAGTGVVEPVDADFFSATGGTTGGLLIGPQAERTHWRFDLPPQAQPRQA